MGSRSCLWSTIGLFKILVKHLREVRAVLLPVFG